MHTVWDAEYRISKVITRCMNMTRRFLFCIVAEWVVKSHKSPLSRKNLVLPLMLEKTPIVPASTCTRATESSDTAQFVTICSINEMAKGKISTDESLWALYQDVRKMEADRRAIPARDCKMKSGEDKYDTRVYLTLLLSLFLYFKKWAYFPKPLQGTCIRCCLTHN